MVTAKHSITSDQSSPQLVQGQKPARGVPSAGTAHYSCRLLMPANTGPPPTSKDAVHVLRHTQRHTQLASSTRVHVHHKVRVLYNKGRVHP
jgi:hypothetical protein